MHNCCIVIIWYSCCFLVDHACLASIMLFPSLCLSSTSLFKSTHLLCYIHINVDIFLSHISLALPLSSFGNESTWQSPALGTPGLSPRLWPEHFSSSELHDGGRLQVFCMTCSHLDPVTISLCFCVLHMSLVMFHDCHQHYNSSVNLFMPKKDVHVTQMIQYIISTRSPPFHSFHVVYASPTRKALLFTSYPYHCRQILLKIHSTCPPHRSLRPAAVHDRGGPSRSSVTPAFVALTLSSGFQQTDRPSIISFLGVHPPITS